MKMLKKTKEKVRGHGTLNLKQQKKKDIWYHNQTIVLQRFSQ